MNPETDNFSEKLRQIDLTLLIPAYNEIDAMATVLEQYCSYISHFTLPWKIIVSVDGADGTSDVVKNFSRTYPFVSLNRAGPRAGKGAAIKRGLDLIDSEYTFLMDADGSVRMSNCLKALGHLNSEDAVLLSRYGGQGNKIPMRRLVPSRGFNMLVRSSLGIHIKDTQTGYKIMKTRLLREGFERIAITNAFFDVALLYYLRKRNVSISEVDVEYEHREESKFNVLVEIMGLGVSLLAFRIWHSRLQRFIPEGFVGIYFRLFKWI